MGQITTERNTMSGEISETAAMTTQGNVNDDGPGMNDGVPPADVAGQVAEGQPKKYPAEGIDPNEERRGNEQT